MTNILTSQLPDSITVGEREIKICTDFRKWIELETTFQGDSSDEIKMTALLSLFPQNELKRLKSGEMNSLIDATMKFFNCGDKIEEKKGRNNGKVAKVYSFDVDQYRIFSDFKRHYDIDLTKVETLHWWIFKQLLFELPEESSFKQVLVFRTIVITSSMSQSQKQYYAQMKAKYSLDQQKLTAGSIGNILGNMGRKSKAQ